MNIKPYSKNAKVHPDKQLKQIARSIKEFGWQQAIVVDKDGVIIVGHGRWFAYEKYKEEMSLPKPEIKTANLTKEKAAAYRLADNKLNESDWDMNLAIENLKELSEEMFDLTGFDRDLLIDVKEDDFDAQAEYDKISEPVSKLGDLWQLGEHRLLCGDSTQRESYEALFAPQGRSGGGLADMVFTDPPYGVGYTANAAKGMKGMKSKHSLILNDELIGSKLIKFLTDSLQLCWGFTKSNSCFYIWHATSTERQFQDAIENAKWEIHQKIIWVKNRFTLTRSDYQHCFEPCYYGWEKGGKHFTNKKIRGWDDIIRLDFNDFQDYLDIIYSKRENIQDYKHPTQKPVRLAERAIKKSSKIDDIVLDVFLGGGSTMMACEQLKRKCYAIELDPKYVDVAIKRYEQSTGNKAKKITE